MEPRAEPRLLVADQEAIERAARALRRGTGFVIVVCPPDLVAAARTEMESRAGELRPTVIVTSGEEMLDRLVEVAGATEGAPIFSVAVPKDARAAMVALNLHREKVLRGGRTVLWLDGAEALEALREVAPDAWAFRTAVILVRGDGGLLPRRTTDEPEEVIQSRKRFKRAKTPFDKVRAEGQLAHELRSAGKLGEAESVARAALEHFAVARTDDDRLGRVYALLSLANVLEQKGAEARQRETLALALKEVDELPLAMGGAFRTYLMASLPGPYGYDRQASEEALSQARRWGVEPTALTEALRAVAAVARSLGDLPRARSLLEQRRNLAPLLTMSNAMLGSVDMSWVAIEAGDFPAAEELLRDVAKHAAQIGADPAFLDAASVAQLFLRGELAAAEERLDNMENAERSRRFSQIDRHRLLLERGRVQEALDSIREVSLDSQKLLQDALHLSDCVYLSNAAVVAHDAERLSPHELAQVIADLDAAEEASLTITGPEPPPWYPVMFRSLRASVRALDPARLPEAVALAKQALELARTAYPDLIPQSGRGLAEHFVASNHPEKASTLLREIEPEAVSRGMLKELAFIRATQIRALVQQSAPPTSINERMHALRDALKSTGSLRITAETLLNLATNLPPTCTHPDVLALAEETQVTFFEMPMPAKEARAIEAAGDALRARGRPAEAKARYAAAKARLERFGLLLRVPLLERKLAGVIEEASRS